MSGRQLVSSGTRWEKQYAYSRAVRIGPHVWVAGTTAVDEHGAVHGEGDPYAQAVFILRKIERALAEAGASLADVVRTRMYVTDVASQDDVGRAHGEFFQRARPCATMVGVAALVDPRLLVEIELEAYVTE